MIKCRSIKLNEEYLEAVEDKMSGITTTRYVSIFLRDIEEHVTYKV